MAKNTIKLKKYSDVIEEFVAGVAITPGMLVTLNADGKVIPHNLDGGNAIPMFALEDELQGKTIDVAYEAGAPVQVWVAGRGDIVYALANSGVTINVGDFLVSAGDGTLKPAGSGTTLSVNVAVSGADVAFSALGLDLALSGVNLQEGIGTAEATGTGTGTVTNSFAGTASGNVVVHAHAIIGQAISAKDASGRVKVRII